MQPIKRTKGQELAWKGKALIEKAKQQWTFWVCKLTKKSIPADDTRTIQANYKGSDGRVSYYVKSPHLQDDRVFAGVSVKALDGGLFLKGCVSSADDAIGIMRLVNIKSMNELLESSEGNQLLLDVLKRENMEERRDSYYVSIGETVDPDLKIISYLSMPSFPIGTITKNSDGSFVYDKEIGPELSLQLYNDREETRTMNAKITAETRDGGVKDFRMIPPGRVRIIGFEGTNIDSQPYSFYLDSVPHIHQENYHVYIGNVEIGKISVEKTVDGDARMKQPFSAGNVVLWTKGEDLEYLNQIGTGELGLITGEIFTKDNFNAKAAYNKKCYLVVGGISINETGKCGRIEDTPEVIYKIVDSYFDNKDNKSKIPADDEAKTSDGVEVEGDSRIE